MGAKTRMVVYCNGVARDILKSEPQLDRQATSDLARKLFPKTGLVPLEDGSLQYTAPARDEVVIGCFPGLTVIAAHEFGIDYPSKLPSHFTDPSLGTTIYLHAMHSVVDWFGYAVWKDGKLLRSLSLSPDDGILEDIGARLDFEKPYWEGQYSMFDPEEEPDGYPFAFHPLELAEAALEEFFGYQIEGRYDESLLDAHTIPLMRFKKTKPFWKIW